MATYSRGRRLPESGDSNNVPGDLAAYNDSDCPSMTTAAIDALAWSRKPAGWQAFDTTKGRLVRSTGAAMVDVVDGLGGTLAGDLMIRKGTPRLGLSAPSGPPGVDFYEGSDVRRWLVEYQSGVGLRINRYSAAGVYQSTPFTVSPDGHVSSVSHIGGVFSGSTNGVGVATFSIPASPTGNWSVALTIGEDLTVSLVGVTSTSVTIRVRQLPSIALYAAGAVVVHWHAIAY